MNKYKCDECGSTNTYVKEYTNEYPVKNELISVTTKQRFCSKCNNLVYDSYLDNITLKEVFKKYNQSIGIDPDKIINLRKQYNLSQEEFSKIIGCAKKTLISYEQGTSIPNDIYLVTIKTLLDNPDIIKNMIDANVLRYTKEELEHLNNKIFIPQNLNNEYTEWNGYTDFSINKIKEMIILLSKDTILKTKLLKEMFYCDFLNYKNTAASITGLEYTKLTYGPVPSDYESILEYLIKNNYIEEIVKYDNNYESHIIKPKKRITIKELNNQEINHINNVRNYFKNFSVKEIVEYSHQEKAFIETDYFNKIPYDYSFDIKDIQQNN